MADVTLDDIQLALVPVSEKSASVYKSVVILYKSIFRAAKESRIIDNNPTIYLTAKGGGVPQKDKAALTDEQAADCWMLFRDFRRMYLSCWAVCRITARRNSCPKMGFCISGCGLSLFNGTEGMAHGK